MGLYIKGMGKAKYCIDCPLMMCNADGDWCALQDAETNESFKSWDDMRKHCPLVEIKAPHGRLIDADEINYVQSEDGVLDDYAYFVDIIELPTIIEAEGKDDG